MCKWDEVLRELAEAIPDSSPGTKQIYHALTYGWLCGGIIEKASGKRFQDLLNEVFVRKLHVEGEFYIGIPAGVESRLASLSLDMEEFEHAKGLIQNGMSDSGMMSNSRVGTIFGEVGGAEDFFSVIAAIPVIFNMLFIRRAVIPAANGHFSARALARYYAMLVCKGEVSMNSSLSEPPLGSHPSVPELTSKDLSSRSRKGQTGDILNKQSSHRSKDLSSRSRKGQTEDILNKQSSHRCLNSRSQHHNSVPGFDQRVFKNPKLHDAFLGSGDYSDLTQDGPFGLGFRRYSQVCNGSQEYFAFGHSGIGGSTAFCYPEYNFSLAITVNKMSRGSVTGKIIKFICSELNMPCPEEYNDGGGMGPDMKLDMSTIN
ncbi:hypothetical protein KP509_18G033300 [Ceratopteris richardii]|uniref:Beta-lactamase-related domain-containing protein n=1 Tax=Ceratopteris richardii TaxID=49495 RepID=A0A8T2SQM3_CERRI|nr:hypothetical protein KP509_18G033300 [Ceratopteris richardii]KAH7365533.1 hypothetical protein KP509_18G033300 [Ceratopteris richardii]